jgi:molecular chaperone GrpE
MTATPEAAYDALTAEVAALRDLFRRRLVDDRDKRQLYEELFELASLARSDLAAQFVGPILRELLLLLDRIDSVGPTVQGSELVESIRAEVHEILARRLVTQVHSTGRPFDPQVHEVVGQTVTDEVAPGTVTDEVRSGWTMGVTLLRPARVIVAAAPFDDRRASFDG